MRITNKLMMAFFGAALLTVSCKKEGCTDPIATNFNEKANKDDGTCEYGPIGGDVITSEITESITAPTTLAAGNIKVCGSIYVSAALTIQPGCNLIMCAGATITIEEEGSINAVGIPSKPIIIRGETSTPGFWSGIDIRSNNPNNQFDYVTISDGGGYWGYEYSNIFLNNSAKLSIKNSVVSNSEGYGLFAKSGSTFPEFSNNTFSNNTLAGLNITASLAGKIDGASSYNVSNGEAFIRLRATTITANTTWPATSTPYLLEDYLYIDAGLVLSPGVTVLMEASAGFEVQPTGYFTAIGTVGSPINIRGRYASAGYWDGIKVESNNPNNKLEYVTMKDGGSYWGNYFSTIHLFEKLEMNNCTINNSNSWAVFVQSSGQIICGGAPQTDAAGVMSYNTISGNGAGADADCVGGGCTVYFE